MGAFDDAAAAIFADDNLALDAMWYAGGIGAGLAVRVLRVAPQSIVSSGFVRAVLTDVVIKVLAGAIATPKKGDVVTIGAKRYELVSPPVSDARGIQWMCDAAERCA